MNSLVAGFYRQPMHDFLLLEGSSDGCVTLCPLMSWYELSQNDDYQHPFHRTGQTMRWSRERNHEPRITIDLKLSTSICITFHIESFSLETCSRFDLCDFLDLVAPDPKAQLIHAQKLSKEINRFVLLLILFTWLSSITRVQARAHMKH